MRSLQQRKQLELNLGPVAEMSPSHRFEEFIASHLSESPTGQVRLMESICERSNMKRAIKRVIKNKGAPGVDGMTVPHVKRYLRRHWDKIEKALLKGAYHPMPVKRKEIPKPGGVRLLGIPTVLDRVIQQATAQVLTQQIWDHTFSPYSYGFRPGRSQHDAIRQYREYVQSGLRYVVDIDVSKFFDRVNHDRLLARLATRIKDKHVLKLVRSFLTAGDKNGNGVEIARFYVSRSSDWSATRQRPLSAARLTADLLNPRSLPTAVAVKPRYEMAQ